MLPAQICLAASRAQSPVLAGLHILAVMQGKASASLLELDGVLVLDWLAIVVPVWLDTALVRLSQQDVTCTEAANQCKSAM